MRPTYRCGLRTQHFVKNLAEIEGLTIDDGVGAGSIVNGPNLSLLQGTWKVDIVPILFRGPPSHNGQGRAILRNGRILIQPDGGNVRYTFADLYHGKIVAKPNAIKERMHGNGRGRI